MSRAPVCLRVCVAARLCMPRLPLTPCSYCALRCFDIAVPVSALSYKIPVYTQGQDTTQGVDVVPTTRLPRDFEPAVDVAIVNDAVELFRWAAIVPGVSVFASVLGGCGAWRANKWCIYATLLVAFTWFHVSLFVSTYPLLTSDLYSEACTTLRATCQATLDDSGWTDGRALASLASTPNLAGEGDVAVGATVIASSPDNGGAVAWASIRRRRDGASVRHVSAGRGV